MERIGFIGLGIMGKPMAVNLLKAGYPLSFYARRAEVIAEMTALGATPLSSSRLVAESAEIIITILPADQQVREVLLGDDGILAGISEDKLIVEMSTISPLTAREMGTAVAAHNAGFMDAPVSGGELGAKSGALTIIAGGELADFQRCTGIFRVLGKEENIFHVGAVGTGQAVKMANQFIGGITMAAIAEALTLGVKAGADPETLQRVISVSSGNSNLFQSRVKEYILKDNFEPGFYLDLKKKDVGIGISMAQALGIPVPVGAAAYQMYVAASSQGLGELDFSAVCKTLANMSGVNLADHE